MPLSALHQTRIPDLNSHTPYIPPHPQRGTPYHRYVLLLLPQPPASGSSYTRNAEARAQSGITTSAYLNIPPVTDAQRRQFDVRAFVRQWGLDDTKGGGAHMWREIWDETVSKIYSDLLSESFSWRIRMLICTSTFRRGGRTELWQTIEDTSVRGVEEDETICVVACSVVVSIRFSAHSLELHSQSKPDLTGVNKNKGN